jgi:cell division protein FtsW
MIRYYEKNKSTGKWSFLFITLILTLLGLIFIYSSSSVFALEHHGYAAYFVHKQLWGLLLGLCGMLVAFGVPTNWIKYTSPYLYLITLGLTALTLIPSFALHIHGSSRWLKLGSFGMQPSEFLKLAFIVYIAYLLVQKKHQKKSFWGSFIPLVMIFGVTALVLLRQPDFGLTVVLSMTLFALLLIARVNGEYLLASFASFIPIVGLLIWFKPYRLKRILTFLDPWSDPQGAGFQIIQSLIAVGSGGLWGLGISNSKQKFFYLPMQHTDFIFAIIAEELGFVGAIGIVFLYVLWLYFGMRLAWSMQDEFATFVTLGFVILISLQALINLCVVTGLFPTKGVGLPFISYGCSGLVANLTMLGLICRFKTTTPSR